MEASLKSPVSVSTVKPPGSDWRLGIPTYIYAVVFSSLCIVWGLLWDIMWHMSIGRDGLFSPPHLLIYVGAVVSGLFSGYQILRLTFLKNHPQRAESVRFWGVFYGSLGTMYCVWGAIAMLTSAPFDDWWHNAYGLDVKILSPPHTVLLLGMMMVQFGAMIGVLALQNRSRDRLIETPDELRQARRLKWLFGLAAGLLLGVLFVLFSEKLAPWFARHSSFYITASVVFPLYLLAVGRASLLRYPITTITAIYLLVMLIPNWVLPLFPATPRLGPVLNPITHYQANLYYPVLLVIPGFALDKIMDRFGGRWNDWWLAALAGVVFLTILVPVQWYFGGFIKTSPLARNWFFFGDSWPYSYPPDADFRYAFRSSVLQSMPAFLKGLGIALVVAALSARVGLWWGDWMKKIQR
ncbi:MAG: hypothetical protein LH606_01765 [Cytophagaceae bacterium]|nr:hypothetical protein [Cytophagaceae bacterium]